MPVSMKKKKQSQPQTLVADHESSSHSISIPSPDGGIVEDLKTAVGHVLVQHPDGAKESNSEQVAVSAVKGPSANVGVKMGRKINTGNYSSSTVEVSLHAPCDLSEDDINSTFDFAVQWVDSKMAELLTKYEN